MKPTLIALAVACSVALFTGCQKKDTAGLQDLPTFVPLAKLTESQELQRARAHSARDRLFGALSSELISSMGKVGPAKSIMVCKTRAPEIAEEVGQEMGVQIGRTSFKLRNDSNRPPDWAARFVSDRMDRELEVELPNKGLGALLPIHLQSTCVICHGKDVMPEVKAAIVSNYPDDRATGFAEGDLRGYFWVEVPPLAKD